MIRRPRSIRWRITLLAGIVVTVVLVGGAVLLVALQSRQLIDTLDRSLVSRSDQIETLIVGGGIDDLVNSNDEDRFVQLVADDGTVVASTSNVEGGPPVVDPGAQLPVFRTISVEQVEDDQFRVYAHHIDTSAGRATLIVGENADDLLDSTRVLVATLAFLVPIAVALLCGVIWWLVGRTLRPVEAIRSEVADIGLERLDRRVPGTGAGDEVDRLASTMNEMLDRLESSSARQQQFVGDASHELRSPLARVRAALEVQIAADSASPSTVDAQVLDDTIEMQHLVDDLLFLARRDAGEGLRRREPVDVDVVVDAEVRRVRAASDAPMIDMSGVSAAAVVGDESQLVRLVRNLLSNAIRHAAAQVTVTLGEFDGDVRLTVEDDGSGIPPAERARVFERFARLDEARSSGVGGTGLGLAIVREIVLSHGGTVEITEAPGGGARFAVTLPTTAP